MSPVVEEEQAVAAEAAAPGRPGRRRRARDRVGAAHLRDRLHLVGAAAQHRAAARARRLGGEEFLIILPDTHQPSEALQALDRLQARLQLTVVSETVPTLRISFSAGYALWANPTYAIHQRVGWVGAA